MINFQISILIYRNGLKRSYSGITKFSTARDNYLAICCWQQIQLDENPDGYGSKQRRVGKGTKLPLQSWSEKYFHPEHSLERCDLAVAHL